MQIGAGEGSAFGRHGGRGKPSRDEEAEEAQCKKGNATACVKDGSFIPMIPSLDPLMSKSILT